MAAKRDVVQISSYSRRLKDNIKSILDNYGEILKAAKVSHVTIIDMRMVCVGGNSER